MQLHVQVPLYQGYMCWIPQPPLHTHLNPQGLRSSATQQATLGKNREHTFTWPSAGSSPQVVCSQDGGSQRANAQRKLEACLPLGRPQGDAAMVSSLHSNLFTQYLLEMTQTALPAYPPSESSPSCPLRIIRP